MAKEEVSEGTENEWSVVYKSRQFAAAGAKRMIRADGIKGQLRIGEDVRIIVADPTFLKPLYAAGAAAAGPVTLVGANVGDKVIVATNLTGGLAGEAAFETVISVAGQIQQISAANLSTNKYLFLMLAQS